MAYQKYIKRNGKTYGPYLYHSRRVNDKVISEYYGHQKKRNYKNIIISVSFILIIFLAIYGINYVKPYFSGKAIFNLNTTYQEGQPLDGVLKLSLKQGEMIPSSAKILFDNNGNVAEYPLSKLVLEEETSEGNFYIQGKNISGKGKGYGLVGEKVTHPVVYFDLTIYSVDNSENNLGSGDLEGEEIQNETPTETPIIPPETSNENPLESPTDVSIENSNIIPEASIETPELVSETSILEQSSIPISEFSNEGKSNKDKEESNSNKKDSSETTNALTEDSVPSITGNTVSNFFKGIFNSFLGLTGTGKVMLNIEKTIEGNVSFGNTFTRALQEGETAELKKDSAYIVDSNGKEQRIDDSSISLDIANGRVIVDTDYSEIEQGFGEEYLGNKEKIIYLNLSSLNLVFEKGDLSVNLAYENQEIVSLVTSLEQGEIITNETLPEIPLSNETIFLNQTNQTLEEVMEFVSSAELSEEEKAELSVYFENFSITTTKSEVFNGRLIRNYKLGDYEVEYSYEYAGKITSELEEQMQKDLMKWLRDILTEVSKKKILSESVESLLGNSSLENKNKINEEAIKNSTIEEVLEQNFTEEILENSTI